jgi:tetratricopeptide (TPR) repeat protein
LYSKDDLSGAESFFNEAIDIFLNNHEESSSCSDSIGRVYNNIACVYYKKNDLKSAYNYIQKSLVAQKNTLGLNSKAESALLNYALTQANTGFLKCKLNHLDALAPLEDSLLVSTIL